MKHPAHLRWSASDGGFFPLGFHYPTPPVPLKGRKGNKMRKLCLKAGGHFWHRQPDSNGYYCCSCGITADECS